VCCRTPPCHQDGVFSFYDHKQFRKLLQEYVPERWPDEEITQRHFQMMAYAGQAILEQIVTNAFSSGVRLSGLKRLVYAGGVALIA